MNLFRRGHDDAAEAGMRLVVGLGNPGGRYEDTRHNTGFMVADTMARRRGGQFKGSKHRADTARIHVDGTPVLVAKPVTFMNDSGHAVRRLVDYYRVPLDRLLVICDDIDLPFGTLRLRPSGGSGGNGGLKSIIRELGTEEFARLRLGVGRPSDSAVRHVLGAFDASQMKRLPDLLSVAADAAEMTVRDGVEKAMNEYNRSYE